MSANVTPFPANYRSPSARERSPWPENAPPPSAALSQLRYGVGGGLQISASSPRRLHPWLRAPSWPRSRPSTWSPDPWTQGHRPGAMDHLVEARPERVRDHLRRPHASGREPL